MDFVCGAAAGAMADMCLFPLDTVRARLMVMAKAPAHGLIKEGMGLVRAEGVAALYKGVGVHLLGSIPSNGIFYCTYEVIRSALSTHFHSAAVCSALGGAAGCLASLALYSPMEVVKQRAMVTKGANSLSVLSALLKTEGPLGLYRGATAGALTWAPYFGLYFFAYEWLLSTAGGVTDGEQPSFLVALGCGLVAGLSASALTNPFDVVKTRLMVGGAGLGAAANAAASSGANSALGIARHIALTEGPAGFARGMLPRALLLAPVSSLTIAFYAVVQSALASLKAGGGKAGAEKRG